MSEIAVDNKNISYLTKGKGFCVVLLHGYLETKEVWSEFANLLTGCKVVMPDLPGHGESEVIAKVHTMDIMAQSVASILHKEKIERCILYGHSMGGYVAQAFSKLYPESTLALGLFHSTIYSDGPEKLLNRNREIELIERGKQNLVIKNMMPKIVASNNFELVRSQLNSIMERALNFKKEGIIAALNGMMERESYVFNEKIPFHLIAGSHDQFISRETYEKMYKDHQHITYDMIEGVGHASFIENPNIAADVVKKFLNSAINGFGK